MTPPKANQSFYTQKVESLDRLDEEIERCKKKKKENILTEQYRIYQEKV